MIRYCPVALYYFLKAPLALQTSNGSLQQLQEQRNNAQNENRAAVATNQHPISLLAQQQQFEVCNFQWF